MRCTSKSSTNVPAEVSSPEYCAWPSRRFAALFEVTCCTRSSACGPRTSISPMWLTSNKPTRSRTARCSSMTPEYSTGMSHPPKSTIFAPMLRCTAFKGVFKRAIPLFFDHRPEHVKAVTDAAVGGSAQTRHGLELVGIDEHVFVNDTIPDVKADDFADHDAAAHGLVADLDNVVDSALQIDRRFEHA